MRLLEKLSMTCHNIPSYLILQSLLNSMLSRTKNLLFFKCCKIHQVIFIVFTCFQLSEFSYSCPKLCMTCYWDQLDDRRVLHLVLCNYLLKLLKFRCLTFIKNLGKQHGNAILMVPLALECRVRSGRTFILGPNVSRPISSNFMFLSKQGLGLQDPLFIKINSVRSFGNFLESKYYILVMQDILFALGGSNQIEKPIRELDFKISKWVMYQLLVQPLWKG